MTCKIQYCTDLKLVTLLVLFSCTSDKHLSNIILFFFFKFSNTILTTKNALNNVCIGIFLFPSEDNVNCDRCTAQSDTSIFLGKLSKPLGKQTASKEKMDSKQVRFRRSFMHYRSYSLSCSQNRIYWDTCKDTREM